MFECDYTVVKKPDDIFKYNDHILLYITEKYYIFGKPEEKPFTETKINFFPFAVFSMTMTGVRDLFNSITVPDVMILMYVRTGLHYKVSEFNGLGLKGYINYYCDFLYKYIPLVDYFQEKCRLKTRRNNQEIDLLTWFERNKSKMEYVLRGKINQDNIIDYTIRYHRMASEFDPMFVCYFIKFLRSRGVKVQRYLDMSAGRGARLIGAIASGCDYLGIDPGKCVNVKYSTMARFYNEISEKKIKWEFIEAGFEENWESKLFKNEKFDVMFSSPPYFDLEIYEETDQQSYIKFSNMDLWIKNFLYVSMDKITKLLRKGGIMAINIDNSVKDGIDFVNPMLEWKNDEMEFLGLVSNLRKKLHLAIWVWQKK